MNLQKQSGSAHIIIIAVVGVAIVGAVGVLFWQNFVNNKTDNDKAAVVTDSESTKKQTTSPIPSTDPVAATKSGISKAMNTDTYAGLNDYMAASVDSAVSMSDGVFNDISGEETTKALNKYFIDYASWNNRTRVTEWKTEDFDSTTNAKLKNMAAQTTFFDFKGSYVATGTGSNDDKFAAFRLDDKGKIVYVFYGAL